MAVRVYQAPESTDEGTGKGSRVRVRRGIGRTRMGKRGCRRCLMAIGLVVEAGAIGGGFEAGLCREPVEMAADVADEHSGQVMGESVAHDYALEDQILTVRGHPVGWHLPA